MDENPTTAAGASAPTLPREAEPRLPWVWLAPGALLRLLAGFLLLFLLGVGVAVSLTGATPVWTAVDGVGELTDLGVTPQADELDPDEVGVDARVAVWLSERSPAGLVGLATFVSHAAKIWVVVPIVVLAGGLVWRRTGRVSAFWVPVMALAGGFALSVAVKFVVFRPRPPLEVAAVEAFGPSFPSGHVIRAAAVYGAFAWLAAGTTPRRGRQVAVWTAAGALVAAVGAARVYEGAHWLTDVLASLLIGGGWLMVVLAVSGLLRRPSPPSSASLLRRRTVGGLLTGLAGLIVLGSAAAVLGRSVVPQLAVTGLDADVTGYLVANRQPWLTAVAHGASWLADLPVVAVLVLVLGVGAGLRSGIWRLLWIPGVAGAGALAISVVVKLLSARDRPPLSAALVDAYGLAFPSGHALRAMAVYGALAWLAAAAARQPALRALIWACAGVVIAAVGFSRIYLGAHWLTDVLAGYVLGGAWLGLALVATAAQVAPVLSADLDDDHDAAEMASLDRS